MPFVAPSSTLLPAPCILVAREFLCKHLHHALQARQAIGFRFDLCLRCFRGHRGAGYRSTGRCQPGWKAARIGGFLCRPGVDISASAVVFARAYVVCLLFAQSCAHLQCQWRHGRHWGHWRLWIHGRYGRRESDRRPLRRSHRHGAASFFKPDSPRMLVELVPPRRAANAVRFRMDRGTFVPLAAPRGARIPANAGENCCSTPWHLAQGPALRQWRSAVH